MNQPLTGGKWGESVWCNWCQQHMGGPLAVCPKCGTKQESTNHCQKPAKLVEPPKLRRPGVFSD